jgi:NUMOD4 motif/HNH endonuclease
MDEQWVPVRGYEGLYEVSDAGRVRSLPRAGTRGGVLRHDVGNNGYPSVRLSRHGRKTHLAVHTLVITAFRGSRPDGQECRHRNGDPMDNRLENLVWGTSSQNSQDTVEHGRTNSRITHCPQGHKYDGENTYVWGGRRYCRACNRNYTRDHMRRVRTQKKEQI